jgi:opacity protein-like surface antigen
MGGASYPNSFATDGRSPWLSSPPYNLPGAEPPMRNLLSAASAALLALAIPNAAFAEEVAAEGSTDAANDSAVQSSSSQSAFKHRGALLDASPQIQKPQISFWGFVPWTYGIGIGGGARFAYPIVPNGFIPMLNDSFELEGGADIWYSTYFSYNSSYVGFAPVVEARWTFHITEKFWAYAKLGLGFWLGFPSTYFYPVNLYWSAGPGVLYKFTDSLYLRAEVMNQGLRVGLGIDM